MTLFVGNNGAGKSTILDALCYGLFGKPFRNIRKAQMINSSINKDLLIEIEFTLNKKKYLIRRGQKPAIFEIFKNGKLLNQSAETKDYQEILEKQILKINFKSFCQVVILGSATFVPFMSLTTGARRDIVEDLLDLKLFSLMNMILKEKIKNNDEEQKKNAAEKRLLEEKIALINEHIETTQVSNEIQIDSKKKKISDCIENINIATSKCDLLLLERQTILDKMKNASKFKKKFTEYSQYENKINIKCKHLEEEKTFFDENDVCPTCTQSILEDFKQNIIKDHNVKIQDYINALSELKIEKNKVEDKLAEMTALDNYLTDTSMSIIQLETQIFNWKKSISELEKDLITLSETAIAVDTGRVIELEKLLEKVAEEYNSLYENKKIMSSAAALLKDDGIKSKIIKQYVPIINKLINKNLAALDFMCLFELDENFNETILSRGRDIFSYSSFSEGEKFRINIAILFAWRALARLRNSISTNILILDEILDGSLDQDGTDEFMKVLSSLTEDNNVFIISHKTDQLIDKFPNTLHFEKVHGFSRIKELQ